MIRLVTETDREYEARKRAASPFAGFSGPAYNRVLTRLLEKNVLLHHLMTVGKVRAVAAEVVWPEKL